MTSDGASPIDDMLFMASKFDKLCKPLFDVSPIVFYAYYEFHSEGAMFRLGTHKKFNEKFVSDFFPSSNTSSEYPNSLVKAMMSDLKRSGFFLRDLDPRLSRALSPALESLNLGHACILTEKINNSVIRAHYFLGRLEDETVNEFYLNNTNLLTCFARFASKQARPLLKSAEPFVVSSDNLEFYQSWIEDIGSSPKLSLPRFLISYASNTGLSKRQKEIIYWYMMGKTTEETSVILGLTKNTVNGYFDRLKEKFGCRSKAQILTILLRDGAFFPELLCDDDFL